jgi:hypothetical protein
MFDYQIQTDLQGWPYLNVTIGGQERLYIDSIVTTDVPFLFYLPAILKIALVQPSWWNNKGHYRQIIGYRLKLEEAYDRIVPIYSTFGKF